MANSINFIEALKTLCTSPIGQQLILIGGAAVRFYGYSRFTEDLDFCWATQEAGKAAIEDQLKKLGTVELLSQDGTFCRLKIRSIKFELMLIPDDTVKNSVLFTNLFNRAHSFKLKTFELRVAAPEELIALKLLAGRHKDLVDILWLMDNTDLNAEILKQDIYEVLSWNPNARNTLKQFAPELLEMIAHPEKQSKNKYKTPRRKAP